MSPLALGAADALMLARPKSPYPGLRPFEADEWSVFFGREQMIDEVIERLAAHRLVLIHGSSGSGKSSLVRAGVLPKLAGQYLRAGTPWRTFSTRPSGGPLWNLAKEIARLEGRADDVGRIDEIVRAFNRRNATLSSVLGSLAQARGQRLCILIDQFEELFRFEKETSRAEAELFVDLLLRNSGDAGEAPEIADAPGKPVPVHIVVTMRSEFLGECGRFKGLAEAINRAQYLVPPMDRASLERAIRRPAMLYGGEVSAELSDSLIAEVAGREDELPLIQHGLMYLWNAAWSEAAAKAAPGQKIKVILDSAALDAAGGLATLLSKHADAVLAEAAPDAAERAAVERMFRALTDLNVEGKPIRRPQAFRELVGLTEAAPETLRRIIDAFRRDGVSFLTPYPNEPIEDRTPIDISHEALVRRWSKLADEQTGWLKREFDDGLIWRSLVVEAKGFATDRRRILSPATTDDRWGWWQQRRVNAAWAERYGGSFPLVASLVDASRRSARRKRRLQYGLVAASLLIGCLGAAYALWTNQARLAMLADLYLRRTVLSTEREASLMPKQEFQECSRCPAMVVVPAGDFQMGSPVDEEGRYGNESPRHPVTIAKPYAVSKFEVTFDQWDTCYQFGGCTRRLEDNDWGRGSRPVILASWDDAQEYVTWLSHQTGKHYRLLSEAEWEYAARAGADTRFSFGNDVSRLNGHAWYQQNSEGTTHVAGQLQPNAFGLYDMHGNVWEWVEDCYADDYTGAPRDGAARPGNDCEHVIRGGSWNSASPALRSADRGRVYPDYRSSFLGFRIARTLAAPAPAAASTPEPASAPPSRAENPPGVEIAKVIPTDRHLEVRLVATRSLFGVCWWLTGPKSPYLVVPGSGYRHRLLEGDNITTTCSDSYAGGQSYNPSAVMVLRFEPLEPQTREFSLVEGDGGENQMIDPASAVGIRYWNFLHVKPDDTTAPRPGSGDPHQP